MPGLELGFSFLLNQDVLPQGTQPFSGGSKDLRATNQLNSGHNPVIFGIDFFQVIEQRAEIVV